MAQVKLLKLAAIDGFPLEMSITDDITLNSFQAGASGPVLGSTFLDMASYDILNSGNISFANGASALINGVTFNEFMRKDAINVMGITGAIQFPVITDTAALVDSFKLPAIAGIPTATPSSGGEGQLVWDSASNKMYAWGGSAWVDTSIATEAAAIVDSYTAGTTLTLGQVVYISAADTVMPAKADVPATSYVVGFASQSVASGAQESVHMNGIVLGVGASFVPGERQYLSATVAGGLVNTPPTASGHNIVLCGYAKNYSDIQIQIQNLGRRA